MNGRSRYAAAVAAGCMLVAGIGHADPDDPTARARAALRQATQRIRELEDQNATFQAKSAEADRAKQELTDKLAADEKELEGLRKQGDADKTAIQEKDAALSSQRATTEKWQSSYNEAAEAARTRDADAKRLVVVVGQARERINACETKNTALYKLSEEVLDLYDKRGFLDSVASSEPVTKLKRVEIENTMQDYEDKFRANKLPDPPQ
jgi:chromosome segregation ATPase